jgi:hypothetical protein
MIVKGGHELDDKFVVSSHFDDDVANRYEYHHSDISILLSWNVIWMVVAAIAAVVFAVSLVLPFLSRWQKNTVFVVSLRR